MKIRSSLSDLIPLAIKNPPREVVKRLLSVPVDSEFRGVIDPNTCDVFIWKTTEATHKQVRENMNLGHIDNLALFRLNRSEQMDEIFVWP